MRFPFRTEQFYDVFRLYNAVVWPTQLPNGAARSSSVRFGAAKK